MMQFTVVSSQFSVGDEENKHLTRMRGSLIHRLDQARKHALNLIDSRMQGLKLFRHEKIQVSGQNRVVLKLIRRPESNVQELTKLGVRCSATALCNVGRDRRRSPSDLAGQSEKLLTRKHRRDVVDAQSQSVALLPDLQLCVVLHCKPSENFCGSFYYTSTLVLFYINSPLCFNVLSFGSKKQPTHSAMLSSVPYCKLQTDNCELETNHAD